VEKAIKKNAIMSFEHAALFGLTMAVAAVLACAAKLQNML